MRRHAPATDRNREPILEVLRGRLPEEGLVVEVACGTGEHAAFFARALPGWTWQPTDIDPAARASADAWCEDLPNVRSARALDTTAPTWPIETADAVFCANMIHIAPIEACHGLLAGAGRILRSGGLLVLYGPYQRNDAPTAPSNASFDASLRAQDPRWGLRLLENVVEWASAQGLEHVETVSMPANNLCVVFRRRAWGETS